MSYIFFISILNLALGFGVAVYVGRQFASAAGGPQPAPPRTPRQTPAPPDVQDKAADSSGATPHSSEDEAAAAEAAEAVAAMLSEQLAGNRLSAEPEREKSASEQSVERLVEGVEQYHQRLARADDELRDYLETPDAEAIETCLSEVLKATEEYLEGRGEAYGQFEEIHAEKPEFDAVKSDMQAAIERQDDQIKSATATIEEFDYGGDLEEGCLQVVTETSKLLDGNNALRGTLHEATVRVARHEKRLEEVDPAARIDELTGLCSRAGLEAELSEWWAKDPHRTRRLSAAFLDIDRFAHVNEQHGHKVGDQVLRTVGQFLASLSRDETIAGRFAGQRFLFLFPDGDSRLATSVAERARQSIELIRFSYKESEFQISVSCAVIDADGADTTETLFARGATTLQEAKRYGRNRTFLHDGKYPTPVVPPNFPLEEKRVVL
ncbi:MAG: GGDEF domain-containing protein [Pirellulales bacterium]|nr:GGDEF domain-containing protein [Pirellulales bacterium]